MSVLFHKDYAVISRHELGHPQVQVFWKREAPPTEDDVPNHSKTFKTGEPLEVAIEWIRRWYMWATVICPEIDDASTVTRAECPHVKPPSNLSTPCHICGALGPWFDSCSAVSRPHRREGES